MLPILRRELIYFWYYFSVQLEQIFPYWVLGMVLGSAISVFAKDSIHTAVPLHPGKTPGGSGGDPGFRSGHRLTAVHVRHNPHCCRLLGERHGP